MCPPTPSQKDAQKLCFDTYLLVPQKRANSAPILCGAGNGFLENVIRLGRHSLEVPLQWSDGHLIATQIVEGKIARKVMRSQKLVLCQVEDESKVWFEVTTLNGDLTYPFNACMIGLICWAFTNYPAAKKQYNKLIKDIRKVQQ